MITWIKMLIMTFTWGSSFVAAKVAVAAMPVHTVAFWRFLIASVILAVFMKMRGVKLFTGWKGFFLAGIASFFGIYLYNIFFLGSLTMTEASKGSLIVASNPVLTMIGAIIIFRERLRGWQIVGMILSFIGTAAILTDAHPEKLMSLAKINHGDILMFIAACCWAVYTLVSKKLLVQTPVLEATLHGIIWGALLFLPSFVMENSSGFVAGSTVVWAGILWLAAATTVVGFLLFYDGVQKLGASKASSFIYFVPVFGVLTGAVMLGEKPELGAIAGGVVVMCGVYLVNRKTA